MAAVLLAGGMGTRLGSDDPKGVYNIGITRELYIFQCLVNNLMEVVRQADTWIHLFVMTSDKNHEATVKFLTEHEFFGYSAEYVHFFQQKMALAVDYDGKVYMEEKGKMASSPNGNGGWFVSMEDAGLVDLIHRAGIEWLNAFAVDNVLQRIFSLIPASWALRSRGNAWQGPRWWARSRRTRRWGPSAWRTAGPPSWNTMT